jgi:hypothetical protein
MTILIDKKAVPHRINIEDYQEEILALHDENFSRNDAEILRRIGSYAICSFRINHKGRIIYTYDQGSLVILSIMLDHKYERLPLLDFSEKTLKQKCNDSTELKFSKLTPPTSSDESDQEAVIIEPFELRHFPTSFLKGTTLPLLILQNTKSQPSYPASKKMDDILQQFLADAVPKRILYLTQNLNFAQISRAKWENKIPGNFEIEFISFYKKFSIPPQITSKTFADFYKNDRNLRNKLASLTAEEIYKEFQLCQALEDDYVHLLPTYSALSHDQLTYIYNAFLDYQNKLNKIETIDHNFQELGEKEALYDLIILEDAHFLSLSQLTQIAGLARNHSIVFAMDETEHLLDNHSIPRLLAKLFHSQELSLSILNFTNNNEHTTKFSAVSEQILKYKKQISGETDEELHSSSHQKHAAQQEKIEQFYCLSTTELEENKDWLFSSFSRENIAVVTNEKFLKEAKKLFQTEAVFLPKDLIGKEFQTVVVYQLFSDQTSKDFFKELSQKQKTSPSSIEKAKLSPIDHKYIQWINALVVTCSSALATLFIIENQTQHNLLLLQSLKSLSDKIPEQAKVEKKLKTLPDQIKPSLSTKLFKKENASATNGLKLDNETNVNFEILKALARNNMRYFKSLLSNSELKINGFENGKTILIHALSSENENLKPFIELLLKHPQIDINLPDQNEAYSPFMHALLKQDEQIIKLFLLHPKLDLNLNTSDYGNALNLAISQGQSNLIKAILSQAKFNLGTSHLHGHSPLFYTISDLKLFKDLFKRPDVEKDVIDVDSHNLFVNAVIQNKLDILEFLLSQKGLNFNFGIPNQQHILDYLIQYFIKHNISINPALRLLLTQAHLNFNPSSSLELVFSAKREGLIKVLLKTPEKIDAKTKEHLGNQVASYLLSRTNVNSIVIQALLSNQDILDAFLKNVISHNKHQDFLPHLSLFFPYQNKMWELLQNFEALQSHMLRESYQDLLDKVLKVNTQKPHFIYSILRHQQAAGNHCLFSKPQCHNLQILGNILKKLKQENENCITAFYP